MDDQFAAAFRHNFYFSDEWARLFQSVAQLPLRTVAIGGAARHVVKDKLVAVATCSDEDAAALRKSGVEVVRVLPVVNSATPRPSLFEYSIWFNTTCPEAPPRDSGTLGSAFPSTLRRSPAPPRTGRTGALRVP